MRNRIIKINLSFCRHTFKIKLTQFFFVDEKNTMLLGRLDTFFFGLENNQDFFFYKLRLS